MPPEVLVHLANIGQPRRPRGAAARLVPSVLPDPDTATGQLASLVPRPVAAADLPGLRRFQRAAARTAENLLAGQAPDCRVLNAFARDSTAYVELELVDGVLGRNLVWDDPSIVAGLARRLIAELAILEPGRLRRCARRECPLIFNDTTRSRTQRWPAEDPCGWRERQHRRPHRTAAGQPTWPAANGR